MEWLLFGGVIAFAIWYSRRDKRQEPVRRSDDPLDIARERYARGEITRDQYEQLRQDLNW